jgi:hypothetical protein
LFSKGYGMRSLYRTVCSAASLACCLAPAASFAADCDRPVVIAIHFRDGSACWRHIGTGTTFRGQFAAQQRITAAAGGQLPSPDSARNVHSAPLPPLPTGPWQISVTGPGGFSADSSDDGRLDTVLPQAGEYSFTIGPCAVWGGAGLVEICTP